MKNEEIENGFKGAVSGSWKEIQDAAEKWFDDMTQKEWHDMERKHGYYGHDIGSTTEDIVNMYKAEFNYR
jgi:hypothetical protein